MTNTPTGNFGYDKPDIGSRGWGTTQNSNLDAIDTDLGVEHRSDSGNHGKHGPKVTITQTNADDALVITKSTSTGDAIIISNSGSGWDVKGTTGVWGATKDGIIACMGITGPNLIGATGAQGITGLGAQGVTGIHGFSGIQGSQGETGIQGQTGIGFQGVTGLQGQTGVQGIGGFGTPFYFWNVASDIGGYEVLSRQPAANAEDSDSAVVSTINGATGLVMGTPYLTPIGVPGIATLQAGTWEFDIWCRTSDTGGGKVATVYCEMLKRTAAGVVSSLFTTTNSTTITPALNTQLKVIYYTQANPITLNTDDRLFVRIYGVQNASGNEATITYYYQGTAHASYLTSTIGKGDKGETGVQGATGIQGVTGIHGFSGIQGSQGNTGVQGVTGIQGVTGPGSLQAAYDGGQTITQSTAITVTQSTAANCLVINKTQTGAGNCIDITNAGTGIGLSVIHTNAASANAGLQVDCSQSAGYAGIKVNASNGSAGIFVMQYANQFGLDIYTAATGSATLAQVRHNNTAANRNALGISDVGIGSGLYITKGATGGYGMTCAIDAGSNNVGGIYISTRSSGAAFGILLHVNEAANSGGCMDTYNTGVGRSLQIRHVNTASTADAINLTNNGNGISVNIAKSHTGAADIFNIDNGGTGTAIDVNQTNTNSAVSVINIANSGTGAAININSNGGSGHGILISHSNTGSTGMGLAIVQNSNNRSIYVDKSNTGGVDLVYLNNGGTGITIDIDQTNTSSAANVIDILNSGTGKGIYINQAGASQALNIDQVGASNAMSITKSSTDASSTAVISVASGSGAGLYVINAGTGIALRALQSTANNALYLEKTNTGSGSVALIDNYGTGSSLYLNQRHTGANIAFYISNAGTGNSIEDDSGAKLTAAGSFTSVSTRISKQNLEELNTVTFQDADQNITDIGAKIDAVKVYRFESKRVPGFKHIGVMAEDFYEAFGVGEDNKTISPTDVAAILWHEVQRLRKRMKTLEDKLGV
jgi:hypothetical protein